SGRRLLESSAPAERTLIETVCAYAEADMSVRQAAERLAVHPNTVIYRLGRGGPLLWPGPSRLSGFRDILAWGWLLSGQRPGGATRRLCEILQSTCKPSTDRAALRSVGDPTRRGRRELTMANYVLVYKGGGMPESKEEREAVMAAWGQWMGGLGQDLVDGGNPF